MNNIEDTYKSFLRKKVESGTRRPGLHVSDLVSECLRKPWYRMSGLDQEIDDDSITAFYYGTTIHESFDGMFETMEYHMCVNPFKEKVTEDMTEPFKVVSGSLDAIYNGDTILDFKTCKTLPTKPSEQYKRQINFYAYMYYIHTGIIIKKGAILYLEKSTGFKEHRVFEFELEDIEITRLKMCRIMEQLEQDEAPEKITTPLCTVCPYQDTCKPTGYYNYIEKKMIYK